MDEQAPTVTSTADAQVEMLCPECGDLVPVTVRVAVLTCGCGEHQMLTSDVDVADLALHAWTHEGDDE